MKRLLVGDNCEGLLSTLEVVLRHWGYRVLVSSRPPELVELLRETSPDLLIMGSRILAVPASPLAAEVHRHVGENKKPLIVLQESPTDSSLDLPHETLGAPPDIFSLFSLVQKHLEHHPRRNLRLAIQLPGMLCAGETCHLAEVLSLSTNGLFVKAGFRPAANTPLRVIIPLLGMKRELELNGRILYRVEPGSDNNYFQGIGIEFVDLDQDSVLLLQTFLEKRFLGDLAARTGGEQLRLASAMGKDEKIVLRLDPA